jgi:hypothetical protein
MVAAELTDPLLEIINMVALAVVHLLLALLVLVALLIHQQVERELPIHIQVVQLLTQQAVMAVVVTQPQLVLAVPLTQETARKVLAELVEMLAVMVVLVL